MSDKIRHDCSKVITYPKIFEAQSPGIASKIYGT